MLHTATAFDDDEREREREAHHDGQDTAGAGRDAGEDAPPVDELLAGANAGDARCLFELFTMLYPDIKAIAARLMSGQPPGHTLQVTALVHEAWMRMPPGRKRSWRDRRHFLNYLAAAVRSILVDYARSRSTSRYPQGERKPLDELLHSLEPRSRDLPALDAALTKLAAVAPRAAKVVELKFFVGLSHEEIADEALDISLRTVERDWQTARDWLRGEMEGGGDVR